MKDVIQKYFSDSSKTLFLKKGEFLFHKGEDNQRLYLLKEGSVQAFDPVDQGEFFKAEDGDFIGLNSFFAFDSRVIMSVTALEDSTLVYIDKKDTLDKSFQEVTSDFMPAVVYMLSKRHVQAHHNNLEQQRHLKKIKDVERLASLGQLSAGVAHELNNAITVIIRRSEHIIEEALEHIHCNELEAQLLNAGLKKGREVSSAEARKIAKTLKGSSDFSDAKLRDYARTGMGEQLAKLELKQAQRAFGLWNLGASLYDLQLAVKQSKHVINSMKSLAATNVVRTIGCDINQSLKNAMVLLTNSLKNVDVSLELGDIPTIYGDSGELVQIWTNIIQNAVDAMKSAGCQKYQLSVKSEAGVNDIMVMIRDSGPGIPEEMINDIFKPHVTTKIQGQTFGLGLGLTIVQKIIKSYAGELHVESLSDGTQFTVKIPIIGENA